MYVAQGTTTEEFEVEKQSSKVDENMHSGRACVIAMVRDGSRPVMGTAFSDEVQAITRTMEDVSRFGSHVVQLDKQSKYISNDIIRIEMLFKTRCDDSSRNWKEAKSGEARFALTQGKV